MRLADYLSEKYVSIDPDVKDKDSLLRKIVDIASDHPVLRSVDRSILFEKLKDREKLSSTGFGNKIAIPHCALDGIEDFVMGIIICRDGIEFDSLDKKKTHLFYFIIGPSDQRKKHINFLSSVSGVLRDRSAVEEILSQSDPKSALECFLRHSGPKPDIEESKAHNILYVFVQNPNKFEDILNIITEVVAVNISVLESNNARKYLYSLPLFSSFWSDDDKGFQRLIIAVMEKSRTNDVIRKLNLIIAEEDDPGVLILMQNIDYTNGSINI